MLHRASHVGEALVAVCRGDEVDLPDDPTTTAGLVAAARHHRVAPLAHHRLRADRPDVAGPLVDDRTAAIDTHVLAALVVRDLGALLGDIPWAVFKGPVLSEFAHPVPGLRSYRDVDVLVRPRDVRAVAHRLLDGGWRVGDFEEMLRNEATAGEMHWKAPMGLFVDLHWSLVNTAHVRRRFAIHADDLLERRHDVDLGFTRAWAFDDADALLHVCLHAANSGANRLLWLLDVDQLVRRGVDWDVVCPRARAWRAESGVALVLLRTRRVLGTPLPSDLAARLAWPRSLGALAAMTDRLSPVPELRRDASLSKLVARAVRRGGAASVVEVGRRMVVGTWHRRPARPSEADPRSPATPRGMDAYLDAVEAAGREGGP